jgi:2-(1,2-epoxy-1,2-dihydrophenyl)acetyl-CoA isomerase
VGKVTSASDGNVLVLTLDDPDTLNAMDAPMAEEFREALQSAADPARGVRCVVITGAGRAFCSGGNLGMMGGGGKDSAGAHGVSLSTHHHAYMKMLRDLPCPVITAVNGPAVGLGFAYALAGDLIVAARSAYFLAAFRNLGVTPDGGLSWTLPRLVGWARARELLLLGNRLPAAQALDWGLINRVYDDETFREDTVQLAREMAAGPTAALSRIRQLAWNSWEQGFDAQLDEEERLQLEAFATQDAREGVMAMLEKRKANFTGR